MNIDILLEKYLTSIKHGSKMNDIFTNPTKKELKELEVWGNDNRFQGFRFIVDFDTKTLYVSNTIMIHYDMFLVPEIKASVGTWSNYIGKGSDKIFTGDCESHDFKNINSDTYYISFGNGARRESVLDNLKKLRSKDFSWLSKWMNPQEVIDIVDRAIEHQESGK